MTRKIARDVVLKGLRHLTPPNKGDKFYPRAPSWARHNPKFVQPKDRVPFWNIVEGDHVKLRTGRAITTGGGEKLMPEGIVERVDREKNWVWLKDVDENNTLAPKGIKHSTPRLVDPLNPSKGYSPNTQQISKPVHYSNLMLKIPGTDDFAVRLSRSAITFNKASGNFNWKRYATIRLPIEKAKVAGKLTERVEIPWPKKRDRRLLATNETTMSVNVENESWIPWQPADPVLLSPPRQFTSELGKKRAEVLTQNRAALDAYKQSQTVPPVRPPDAMGIYPGFDIKVRAKPPPIAQPPTPAETLRERKQSAAEWANASYTEKHRESGGLSFLYTDYLDVAPRAGPASGGDWSDLPVSTPGGGLDAKRDPHTGRLTAGVSRSDLDRMPIELMMQDELTNVHGLKMRMRRFKKAQAEKKVAAIQQEAANKELLKELAVLKL